MRSKERERGTVRIVLTGQRGEELAVAGEKRKEESTETERGWREKKLREVMF